MVQNWSIFHRCMIKTLPDNIHGLLLGGGYPNYMPNSLRKMRVCESRSKKRWNSIYLPWQNAVDLCICMRHSQTKTEKLFLMVGVIPAECQYTGKLVRFGYVEVQLPQGLTEKGTAEMTGTGKIKAHEFHYFDSTANGEDCIATKPVTGRSWKCIHASDDHFWGFPHLYYPSDPKFVKWFLERTEKTHLRLQKKTWVC